MKEPRANEKDKNKIKMYQGFQQKEEHLELLGPMASAADKKIKLLPDICSQTKAVRSCKVCT